MVVPGSQKKDIGWYNQRKLGKRQSAVGWDKATTILEVEQNIAELDIGLSIARMVPYGTPKDPPSYDHFC